MSIRLKILLACLSLTAITIGSGTLARISQTELGQIAFRLYDDAFMSMSYLRSAQNTLLSVSRDLSDPTADRQFVDEKLESTLSDIQVAHDRALSPEGAAAATSLKQQLTSLQKQTSAGTTVDRQSLASVEDRFDTAVEIFAGDGFRARRETGRLVDHVVVQTWTVMGISVAVALAITIVLSRSIVPSLMRAVGLATNIASGRLDNPIAVVGGGETAVLLRALGSMQRSIADKIGQIEALMAQQASSHAIEIAAQHLRFEVALDNMVQGLCLLDADRRVLVHNRRFGEMFAPVGTGVPLLEALPKKLLLTDEAECSRHARLYSRTLEDERTIAVSERPMDTGEWVVTYEDVTERHRNEARLAHMERHDALTGLPNRLFYHEHMGTALRSRRSGDSIAVLYLNLDHFKAVNDRLGHSLGDALLCSVSERLTQAAVDGEIVLRLGGDEFGVILCSDNQPEDARRLAERLLTVIAEPFLIDGHRILTGTSIGIAVHSDGLGDSDTLLKSADLALYRAKADGRGISRFFEVEMDAVMRARRSLEIDLREAVESRQFEVFYQPLITTRTREVSGFEALVRWPHPTRGMVSPAEFIPVAEELGLIGQLGALVLERACMDAVHWPDSVKIAVNLSPLQLRNQNLAAEVAEILARSGLPACRLELEVTESVLLQDSTSIMQILHEIRLLGVRVSMDDFGTGYSSLSYLRRFPFDKIKIDQSFIRTLEDRNDCLAIVRAVLGLGRSLGMSVVAEGVETEAQFALLSREGCEQLQGYLFSKPQPISAVPGILARFSQRDAA